MINRPLTRGATLPALDAELAATWAAVAHQMTQPRVTGAVEPPSPSQNCYSLPVISRDAQPLRLMLNVPTKLVVEDLADLAPAERQDISYHGATRLGDVLFNWFD